MSDIGYNLSVKERVKLEASNAIKEEKFKDLSQTEQQQVGELLRIGAIAFDDNENASIGVISTIDKEVVAAIAAAKKTSIKAAD